MVTKCAGSPKSRKGDPWGGPTRKGPEPPWWRNATIEETRARETIASAQRRKVVNTMGTERERVNAILTDLDHKHQRLVMKWMIMEVTSGLYCATSALL